MGDDSADLSSSEFVLIDEAHANGPGAQAARLELLNRYHPLISSVIRQCGVLSNYLDDARQAAVVGFLVALKRFTPKGEVRDGALGRYARAFIKHEVLLAVYGKQGAPAVLSIEALLEPDDDGAVDDSFLADPSVDVEEEALASLTRAEVAEFVRSLQPRPMTLVYMLFWLGLAQVEIARRNHMSRQSVSNTLSRVFARGRKELETIV